LDTVSREPWFLDPLFLGQCNAEGSWGVDANRIQAELCTAIREESAVLLAGTAFNYVHLLDALQANHVSLRLPRGSRLMETGGYKGRSRELSREELHSELSCRLGISPEYILTEYGMSELGSQAYAQVAGAFPAGRTLHFPPWARVSIVSAETGLEVANGETGLVRVLDLANVYSVLAVETEDLAIRRDDGIELLGRNPRAEPRGCSLMAV